MLSLDHLHRADVKWLEEQESEEEEGND